MTEFAGAQPYPHVVLDELLPHGMADDLVAAFPTPDAQWINRTHLHSRKQTWADYRAFPPVFRAAVDRLHSRAFLDRLERITGARGVLPDPDLFGGGLHLTTRGGFLDIHADFLDHPKRPWKRVLNLLYYLNPEWQPTHRGELELWDVGVTRCVRRIAPRHNRAVLFATSATSYHGHPVAYTGPARRSLALYYYVEAARTGQVTTVYRPRPWDYGKRLRKWARRMLG